MRAIDELGAAGEVLAPAVQAVILKLEAVLARVDALEHEVAELRARLGRAGVAISIRLFHHWHRFGAGQLSRAELSERLLPARRRMARLIPDLLALEDRRACGLGRDLAARESALWSFARTEGVEPTNNRAERALRKLVLWRKTSFGSDRAGGVRFVERILSVVETCRQQRKNAFDFLHETILAHRSATPPPALFA